MHSGKWYTNNKKQMTSIFDFPLVCEYCECEYHNDNKHKCVSEDGLDFCCEECMNSYENR